MINETSSILFDTDVIRKQKSLVFSKIKPKTNTFVMNTREEYEQYLSLHRCFSEEYSRVYKHVMDFYPLPQKFIKEASPAIDNLIEAYRAHQQSTGETETFQNFMFFADNFKSFATDANSIFEQYKGLHSESGNYIKTVFKLKEKTPDPVAATPEYMRLVPVLNKLIAGFEQIKQRTDETAQNLQKLQSEWGSLKQKIDPAAPSIRP